MDDKIFRKFEDFRCVGCIALLQLREFLGTQRLNRSRYLKLPGNRVRLEQLAGLVRDFAVNIDAVAVGIPNQGVQFSHCEVLVP